MSSSTARATVFGPGIIVWLSAAAAALGCGEPATVVPPGPAPPPPVATVVVSPASASILVGETTALDAVVSDATGRALSGRAVTWESDSPAVATVTSTGLVSGVSVGQAVVTATSEGKSGSATIQVKPIPVATVEVAPHSLTIIIDRTAPLAATARDARGNTLEGRTAIWTSRDAAVATVAPDGVVSSVGVGSTTVVASVEGALDSALVQVILPPVATVTVDPSAATLTIGSTKAMSATPKDSAGGALTGRAVVWSTSAVGIATVSASGLVTAVAPGTTAITAEVEGTVGSAQITVVPPPVATVAVNPPTATLALGRTIGLSAEARDASGNTIGGKIATWSTSAAAVATVSNSGVVTGVGVGVATISATIDGVRGAASVTVLLPSGPNFVELQSDSGDFIGAGGNYQYDLTNAVFSVTTDGGRLSIRIVGDETWDGEFQGPASPSTVRVGAYPGLNRYDPTVGGLTWFGDGRGCNTLAGRFTVWNVVYSGASLIAVDLSFEQACEGAAATLRGTIHWRSNDTSVPPGPVHPSPASLWKPAPGTTPPTGTFAFFASDPGDFVGGGTNHSFTPANAVITVSATGGRLTITISAFDTWYGQFEVMNTRTQFAPGYYPNLRRFPFHNPTRGGISWSGEGRGCNTLRGWFVVDSVTYSGGVLRAIELRFEQHCEGATPALHGAIRWST